MSPLREARETALRVGAAALVLWLALDLLEPFESIRTALFQGRRLDTERPLWNACIYLGAYAAVVVGLATALCHRRPIRIAAIVTWLLAICIQAGVGAVNGVGFTHHEAMLLFTESAHLGDALGFFWRSFLPAVLLAGSVGAAAIWLALRVGPRLRAWAWLALPLAGALGARQVVDQTFGKVYQFPAPARLALLTEWAWQHRLPLYERREAPFFPPSQPSLADHIVFVVDESVTGHWLSVNGAREDTTPWLASAPEGLFNYGVASAASNLSSSSNLVLQTGLGSDACPDRELRGLRWPNVFDYFSAAGFFTALIDAQTYSDAPPNLMTGFDLQRIDLVIRLREKHGGIAEHAVDFAALPEIEEILRSHPRSFTYLLKTGAHLPYGDKFPAESLGFPIPASPGAQRVRAEYRNALRWTVDAFLHDLARLLESTGEEAIVVYTSDHGQWLGDEGDESRRLSPHATVVDPPSDQASVPLLVLALGERTRDTLATRFVPNRIAGSSAFAIFPTLLQLAGFAATDTAERYPPSLFEPSADAGGRVFFSGNLFGGSAGAYVLNREIGDACVVNPFEAERLAAPAP